MNTKSGLSVEVRNNNVDIALKILNKKMKTEKIQKELSERRYYEKPSDKKRRKKAAALKRLQKRLTSEKIDV